MFPTLLIEIKGHNLCAPPSNYFKAEILVRNCVSGLSSIVANPSNNQDLDTTLKSVPVKIKWLENRCLAAGDF